MEGCPVLDINAEGRELPTDPEFSKGIGFILACCDYKKCCKKYKKGNRCKKCPGAKH